MTTKLVIYDGNGEVLHLGLDLPSAARLMGVPKGQLEAFLAQDGYLVVDSPEVMECRPFVTETPHD